MAAYDPKRPRPAQLADAPPPVEALLPPAVRDHAGDPASGGELPSRPEVEVIAEVEPEVPVAPAPEVGTTNRAVLFAVLGAAATVLAVLIVWRVRRARAGGEHR